jgi:hypothetical protein
MSPTVRAWSIASLLVLSGGCDDSSRSLRDGAGGTGGNGSGSADLAVPDDGGSGGGGITLTDGGVALTDGGMPTHCTLGAAGAIALIPTETMAPGTACGACHLVIGKPLYIAGTVFPTLHEADLCLGVSDVKVELVDNSGATHLLDVNSSGNFLDNSLLELWPSPWTVAVVRGTARRPMVGTVTSGDCNSCHTAPGANSAPGRILAPDGT